MSGTVVEVLARLKANSSDFVRGMRTGAAALEAVKHDADAADRAVNALNRDMAKTSAASAMSASQRDVSKGLQDMIRQTHATRASLDDMAAADRRLAHSLLGVRDGAKATDLPRLGGHTRTLRGLLDGLTGAFRRGRKDLLLFNAGARESHSPLAALEGMLRRGRGAGGAFGGMLEGLAQRLAKVKQHLADAAGGSGGFGAALKRAGQYGDDFLQRIMGLSIGLAGMKGLLFAAAGALAHLVAQAAAFGGANLLSAIAPLLGVLGLIPALAFAAASALGVLVIGTSGFMNAVKVSADPKKFAAALKNLAPAAQEAAKALAALAPTLRGFRNIIQQGLFAGVAGDIKRFGALLLPAIAGPMRAIATQFSGLAGDLTRLFTSNNALAGLQASFGGVAGMIASMRPGIVALVDALGRMVQVGASLLPGLGGGFTALMQRFDAFIARVQGDGSLRAWIKGGLDAFASLGRILMALGGILGGIISAVNSLGVGGLSAFAGYLRQVSDTVNSMAGQNGLSQVFEAGRTALAALAPAVGALLSLLVSLTGPLSQVLLPVILALTPVVSQLAAAMQQSLGPALANLGPTLAGMATSLGQMFVAIIPLLPAILQGATNALQFAAAFGGGLVGLVTGLANALGQMGPVTTVLATALGIMVIALVAYRTIAAPLALLTGALALAQTYYAASAAAAAAGSGVLTIAMGALSTAIDANPISLIVLGIIALGVAAYEVIKHVHSLKNAVVLFAQVALGAIFPVAIPFLILYHKCAAFRNMINDTATTVRNFALNAAADLAHFVATALRGFAEFASFVIKAMGAIVHAGAKMFGWVPILGVQLQDADRSVAAFRDNTVSALVTAANAADSLGEHLDFAARGRTAVINIVTVESTVVSGQQKNAAFTAPGYQAGLAKTLNTPAAPPKIKISGIPGIGGYGFGNEAKTPKAKIPKVRATAAALALPAVVNNAAALKAAWAGILAAVRQAGQAIIKHYVSPLQAATTALVRARAAIAPAEAAFLRQSRSSAVADQNAARARTAYARAHSATVAALVASGGKMSNHIKDLERMEAAAKKAASTAASSAQKHGAAAMSAAKAARAAAAALLAAQQAMAQVVYDAKVAQAQVALAALSTSFDAIKTKFDNLISTFASGINGLLHLQDIWNRLASAVNATADAANNVVALKDAATLADELGVSLSKIANINAGTGVQATMDAVAASQRQVDDAISSARQFLADLRALSASGASEGLIQQVTALGPEAGDAYAKALLTAGRGAISAMSSSLATLNSLTTAGAKDLASTVYGPMLTETQRALNALKTQFAGVFGEIAQNVTDLTKTITAMLASSTSTGGAARTASQAAISGSSTTASGGIRVQFGNVSVTVPAVAAGVTPADVERAVQAGITDALRALTSQLAVR